MTTRQRIGIAALALSAMGLVKLVNDESFTPVAVIPVQGDRPTVGFGSTFRDDGSPVQMGDTITVPQALKTYAGTHSKRRDTAQGLRDGTTDPG